MTNHHRITLNYAAAQHRLRRACSGAFGRVCVSFPIAGRGEKCLTFARNPNNCPDSLHTNLQMRHTRPAKAFKRMLHGTSDALKIKHFRGFSLA
jgi:hypothetical protein